VITNNPTTFLFLSLVENCLAPIFVGFITFSGPTALAENG
jgi:hypothetical protein